MYQSAVPGPQSSVIYFDSTPQASKYAAGSKSWRTNNPGLVGMSILTAQHGALGSALGVAVFGDPESGRRALIASLGDESLASATVAQTLSRFIPGYTPPPRETDPAAGESQPWMEPETGIDLELTMSAVGGGQRRQLADLIEREIGYIPGIITQEPLDAGSFNQSRRSSGSPGNVLINGRSAVHAGSGGALSTLDVCDTPSGDSCPPRLYTNLAQSSDAAKTAASVNINGNPACIKSSIFSKSTGDQPGRCGGVSSGTIKGKAEFITASPNVMIEGESAVRQFDLMISNNRNTPPAPLMQSGGARPPFLEAGEAEAKEAIPSPFRALVKAESSELGQLKSLTIIEAHQASLNVSPGRLKN
jgi:hypothetical protein